MAKRSVLTRALIVVALTACAAIGAPGSALRLLPVFEENTGESRAGVENADHLALCARSARRGRMRHHRRGVEPPSRTCLPTISVRHRAVRSLPNPSLSLLGWPFPLRC